MSCPYYNKCGRLCPHFVVTTAVTFADGTLTLTLPDTVNYANGEKYCIVIGQTIPEGTTLNAPVVAVIGAGTTEFPLLSRRGVPVVSQQVGVRYRYPLVVRTTADGGNLMVQCDLPRVETSTLAALNDAEGGAA